MTATDIIIKPLLAEKPMMMVENKKYAFVVNKNATKLQIAAAVEELFDGAKVEYVHTMNCIGKYKRQGKYDGYTSEFKKAYVQLTKASKTISFFDSLN
ncbi:MAG: 50S ribosomal protein L23 [Firmicutes bacterium]|nr:50S ribosomal protein L23 [Bacillota bacterium]